MQVTCGIDWAQDHHDIALVAADGAVVAQRRIGNDAAGFAELLAMLAKHDTRSGLEGEGRGELVRSRSRPPGGCWSPACRPPGATSMRSTPLRPLATGNATGSRGRSRMRWTRSCWPTSCGPTGTPTGPCRDSEQARAVAVLARAQQHAVWDRVQVYNQLRQLLGDFYPAALAAFAGTGRATLDSPAARTILIAAPTPQHARALTVERLRELLVQAGRQRGVDREARRLHAILTAPQPRQAPLVEQATGHHLLAVLRHLDVVCGNLDDLTQAAEAAFAAHPDATIITSFPGVGLLTGARLLAELGDDRARFADAKALKAYAGTAPDHPCLRTPSPGQRATSPQRLGRGRRLHVDGDRDPLQPRRPGAVRPSPRRRRLPQRRPTQPAQPAPRQAPPLPPDRCAL
jgi:hypothetical protein